MLSGVFSLYVIEVNINTSSAEQFWARGMVEMRPTARISVSMSQSSVKKKQRKKKKVRLPECQLRSPSKVGVNK